MSGRREWKIEIWVVFFVGADMALNQNSKFACTNPPKKLLVESLISILFKFKN